MFSVDALGRRYMINAPAMTSLPNGKVETIRIIATAAGTNLTYDPPQAGAPTTIATAGGFAEIKSSAASFLVTADQKVLVAQYMSGQDAGGGAGDFAANWDQVGGLDRGDVAAIQRGLEVLGHDTGGADGLPGFRTRRAIGRWQEARGQPATCWPEPGMVADLAP